MRKGITPIIAIIILLLITMSMAATAWVFLSGYLDTMVGKSFVIPTNAAGCSSDGTIRVYITNTGSTAINIDDDVDMCLVDGDPCTGYLEETSIEPQQMGIAITYPSETGSHTVQLGIGAHTGTINVVCP